MSKVIESPVKRFPGTVTLADPLSFPQLFAFQDALEASRALGEDTGLLRQLHAILPGVLACVEKWDLQGVDPEKFPASPTLSVAKLLNWLIGEISALLQEADEVPNG